MPKICKRFSCRFVLLSSVLYCRELECTYQILKTAPVVHSANETKTFSSSGYRGIHADVIVYIFAHLYTALVTKINMLDMN